jgi:hypothetical protein
MSGYGSINRAQVAIMKNKIISLLPDLLGVPLLTGRISDDKQSNLAYTPLPYLAILKSGSHHPVTNNYLITLPNPSTIVQKLKSYTLNNS